MSWIPVWGFLPVDQSLEPIPVSGIRRSLVFTNNVSGRRVRVKVSNLYGTEPVSVSRLALADAVDGSLLTELTVGGKRQFTLAPKGELWSDPAAFETRPGQKLKVMIEFADQSGQRVTTIGNSYSAFSFQAYSEFVRPAAGPEPSLPTVSAGGQAGQEATQKAAPQPGAGISYLVCEVQADVEEGDTVRTVSCFGDSITSFDYFSGWLTKAFYQQFPGMVTVVNRGIGGNRLLRGPIVPIPYQDFRGFGPAGVKRFGSDTYRDETPTDVVLFICVNDLMHARQFGHPEEADTWQDMAEGIRKVCSIAHAHGSRIYVGTVTPFGIENGADWYKTSEQDRLHLNQYILDQGSRFCDGVMDFGKALADPAHPDRQMPDCHVGDGLHPNSKGGKIMAALTFETMTGKKMPL